MCGSCLPLGGSLSSVLPEEEEEQQEEQEEDGGREDPNQSMPVLCREVGVPARVCRREGSGPCWTCGLLSDKMVGGL